METAHMTEHILDHTKAPSFMDTAPTNYFETLSGMDSYLQYPHSPFGVSDMAREYRIYALAMSTSVI